eukprot:15366814-Ditylum_brightwellii.AAC.1
MFFLNPNGLSSDDDALQFQELSKKLQMNQVDIIGISEHNLDTTKSYVYRKICAAIYQTTSNSVIKMFGSNILAPNIYKPGGTMIYTMGNVTSRKMETVSDKLGRWSYVKLVGKDHNITTIVVVYVPCKTTKTGTSTYHQQLTLFNKSSSTRIEPQKQYIKDLKHWLKQCKEKNEKLIIAGDFNSNFALGSYTSTLLSDPELDLTNLMYDISNTAFSTSKTGRDIIDHILVLGEIIPAVTRKGYTPFDSILYTDHRGMFVDFNNLLLFGNITAHLVSNPSRDI